MAFTLAIGKFRIQLWREDRTGPRAGDLVGLLNPESRIAVVEALAKQGKIAELDEVINSGAFTNPDPMRYALRGALLGVVDTMRDDDGVLVALKGWLGKIGALDRVGLNAVMGELVSDYFKFCSSKERAVRFLVDCGADPFERDPASGLNAFEQSLYPRGTGNLEVLLKLYPEAIQEREGFSLVRSVFALCRDDASTVVSLPRLLATIDKCCDINQPQTREAFRRGYLAFARQDGFGASPHVMAAQLAPVLNGLLDRQDFLSLWREPVALYAGDKSGARLAPQERSMPAMLAMLSEVQHWQLIVGDKHLTGVETALACLRQFIEAGVDPNEPVAGRRPLEYALERGGPAFLQVLLDHGADPALLPGGATMRELVDPDGLSDRGARNDKLALIAAYETRSALDIMLRGIRHSPA